MEEEQVAQQSRKHKKSRIVLIILFVIIVFYGGYLLGGSSNTEQKIVPFDTAKVINKDAGNRVDFKLFWRAWDLLKDRYVDHATLDAQDLMYGAIQGMFAATEDPYTIFLDPEMTKSFNEDLEGTFQGIGAEIGIKENLLTVIAPLEGSPAERAGLRSGDRIIAINEEISAEMSIDDAVKKIRGDKGTEVILTIFRDGATETQDITIVRDDIFVESVKANYDEENVAVIRLSQFGVETGREFFEALQDVEKKNVDGLVIDLRNNPGGILQISVEMIGYFVPKNSTAVIERDALGNEKVLATKREPIMTDMPIVILINQGSASASEIFAAALKAHYNNVTLVGKTTFGKGSVQELVPMRGETAAKITVAKWLTPQGDHINEVGISPDHEIEYTNEDFEADRDPQMDVAVQILRGEYVAEEVQEDN